MFGTCRVLWFCSLDLCGSPTQVFVVVTFLAAVTKYLTKQLKGQSTYLGSPVGGATHPGKEGMTSGA